MRKMNAVSIYQHNSLIPTFGAWISSGAMGLLITANTEHKQHLTISIVSQKVWNRIFTFSITKNDECFILLMCQQLQKIE